MFWSNEIPDSKACPKCRARLEKEYHTYLIAGRKGKESEFFITGNDNGYFCPNCAIVVLDYDMFAKLISMYSRNFGFVDFAVLGIVNIDAIPEDKKSMPIGDEDNPVPLVQFTNKPEDISDVKQLLSPHPPIADKPKAGRNDPCPCGSGLKFKKCCLKKYE